MTGRQRLAVAHGFELAVADGLRARGWDVELFGVELLSEAAIGWLHTTPSAVRWLPDLLARRGDLVIAVDAKASLKSDRHTVEIAAIRAAIAFEHYSGLRELFVFPDGCVCRPGPAYRAGEPGRYNGRGNGSGTPFLYVYCASCLSTDDVFGRVSDE